MTLERFLSERTPAWDELAALVRKARRKPERLGPDGVRRLGALYRAASADLALARRAFPGTPVVARLEELVPRARHLVYEAPGRRTSVIRFIRRDYWRLVAERPLLLLLSAALLFGPAALSGGWALRDPGAAAGLVPSQYRSVTEPRSTDLGLGPDEEAAFASEISTNNIRVTFAAFAGGIVFTLGTALILLTNGILLGTVGGLAVEAGNARTFFELVTAHGVLEVSCIVVAGAAGIRLGWSVIDPGRRSRTASLQAEARAAVAIVIGTAPWLVVAGVVEGFVTPAGTGLATVLAVGLALGALYWALVLALGRATRPRGPDAPSPAGTT
jgi:uncharacterized membrane protein SpoIIM required for sporulation